MKKIFILLSIIISLPKAHAISTQKTITEGVTYSHLTIQQPVTASLHMVDIDPTQVSLQLVAAHDKCVGRETVSAIAKRSNATVAINGGFSNDEGIPAGILKINQQWFSNPKQPRAALGWRNDGKTTIIDNIDTSWQLSVGNQTYPINRVNQQTSERSTVLYTPTFDKEVLVNPKAQVITIAHDTIIAIQQGVEKVTIPPNGFVYVIGSQTTEDASLIKVGMTAAITTTFITKTPEQQARWQEMDNIVGGAGLLVKNGKKITNFFTENIAPSFIEEKYPRTAVGILPNGHWLLVVIDGRDAQAGKGVSLPELAEIMFSLDCQDALNLCGGKSSTLWIQGTVVTNAFSFQLQDIFNMGILLGEKSGSDAIIVKSKMY